MNKLNWRFIAWGVIVGMSIVGLFLPLIVSSYTLKIANQFQSIALRELSESERIKIYLYEKTGYNYSLFKSFSKIIDCESNFNPNAFNPKSNDFGLMQVNQFSWDKKAQELGLDYKYNWKDNIDMGFIIYEKYGGFRNWSWSYQCHKIKDI